MYTFFFPTDRLVPQAKRRGKTNIGLQKPDPTLIPPRVWGNSCVGGGPQSLIGC